MFSIDEARHFAKGCTVEHGPFAASMRIKLPEITVTYAALQHAGDTTLVTYIASIVHAGLADRLREIAEERVAHEALLAFDPCI